MNASSRSLKITIQRTLVTGQPTHSVGGQSSDAICRLSSSVTLNDGPVAFRPVRAKLCFILCYTCGRLNLPVLKAWRIACRTVSYTKLTWCAISSAIRRSFVRSADPRNAASRKLLVRLSVIGSKLTAGSDWCWNQFCSRNEEHINDRYGDNAR